ncbi:hypothetical protein [Nocardia sp. NPDC050435]|uniref:hypothetical protein n=1 Tax=Nocardia sp. NPDC050435 TaxID=3155040 RepID=UPI0033CED182
MEEEAAAPEPAAPEPAAERRGAALARRAKPFGGWLAAIGAGVAATVIAAVLVPSDSDRKKADGKGQPFTVVSEARRPSGVGWMTSRVVENPATLPAFDGDWDRLDERWKKWVQDVRAVPATALVVDFTVQGTSEAEVTLTGLTVRVTDRRPAFPGTHVIDSGAGDNPYRYVAADLDTDPPTLSDYYEPSYGSNVPPIQRRPIQFPYQVKLSDAESFEVSARTQTCDCEFVIELTWIGLGRQGSTTIDDKGKPFRVAAISAATHFCGALSFAGFENSCHPA